MTDSVSHKYDTCVILKCIAKPCPSNQISVMKKIAIVAFGILFVSTAHSAFASSSQWFETDGGRIRLVTTGKADAEGRLTGALDIDLKPGWKTYWRDPGDTGVPPQVDISSSKNIAAAELQFPAPQRHDDGYGKWAGYNHPVALPVVFTLKSANEPATVEAGVFLGVCEEICIPVQASLTVDPAADPDNPDDAAIIETALANLPGPERADFGVKLLPAETDTMLVEASFPGDADSVDFFVAAADGYSFASPVRVEKDGKLFFSVPVLDRPAERLAGGKLHYTLVTGAGAVSGLLPYP